MKTLAEELFMDFAKRMGISASWNDQPLLQQQWKTLAEMFEARTQGVKGKMTGSGVTTLLPVEADKMLRFVAGLDLQDLSVGEQRERRERVYALRQALGKK